MFCSQGLRNDIPGLWFISIDLFFRPSVLVHVPIGSNFIGNNLTMLWQQRKMENKCYTNCFFFNSCCLFSSMFNQRFLSINFCIMRWRIKYIMVCVFQSRKNVKILLQVFLTCNGAVLYFPSLTTKVGK